MDDYIEFRFSINSITMEHDDVGSWTKFRDGFTIRRFNRCGKIRMSKIYSIETIESTLRRLHLNYQVDSLKSGVPGVGDDDWLDYLMTTYKSPNFELKSHMKLGLF